MKLPFGLAVCVCVCGGAFAADTIPWKQEKGDHCIVYYTGNDHRFAREVRYQAEKNYVRIARYFGYSRHSNFWTWENRVAIFIYPDSRSYINATQMPAWSKGMANYTEKYIATYIESDTFLEDILPHEMAHLIFRDFVGFRGEVPLWLDEGVAQWAELNKRERIQQLMQNYRDQGLVFSLADMMQIDIRQVSTAEQFRLRSAVADSRKHSTVFLQGNQLIRLYYTQAASVVAFLIERFGIEPFAVFCRSLRDGSGLDEALTAAYGSRFSNVDELQDAWLEYVGQEGN